MKTYKFMMIAMICIIVFLSIYSICNGVFVETDRFANEFASVFGSYDIARVDAYFDAESEITCRGVTKKYREVRENILRAFEEKKFSMNEGMSYGNGSVGKPFVFQAYVMWGNNGVVEISPTIELEQIGIRTARVASFSCDHSFYRYLFFGDEAEIENT